MKTKIAALFILLILSLTSFAETFVVTSNADSGPGTLREAIEEANANGATLVDNIYFNLADVTIAGRRITLASELPPLTSNIIIDASTQPGNKFGVSDVKIELFFSYAVGTEVRAFKISKCNNIGIYGLKITDNITWTQWYKETICFRIENSTNIQIGDIGKGNVIINWIHAVQGYGNVGTANEFTYNKNINIYSNFFNLDDDGETAIGDGDLIVFNRIENINIGNLDPLSGNVMAATRKRISIANTKGAVLVASNKIGTNYTGTKMLSQPYGEGTGAYVFPNILIENSPWVYEIEYNTDVKIINNLSTGYCSSGIRIVGVGKKIYVQGNKIGTDITGTQRLSPAMDWGIFISNCISAIIGVENDEEKEKNIIAFTHHIHSGIYDPEAGVYNSCPSGITISRNSIFCNGTRSIALTSGKVPVVTINNITFTSISGSAPPLSKIELFRDDDCVNCEVKTYFDAVYADVNGKWQKDNINTDGVVATATDASGMTSEATAPQIEIDAKNFKIKNTSCGQTNGEITGINIVSGTRWYWEDDEGNIVSKDSALKNVGPGSYRLVVGIGSNSCDSKTQFYQIQDISFPSSLTPDIVNASCGKNNGSMSINYDTYSFKGKWTNSNGDIVTTGGNLQNAFPGNYYFQLSPLSDSSCIKTYGLFTIINLSGPTLLTDNMQISQATCGQSNGNIKNISSGNVTGTPFIQWVDSLGKGVGSALSLNDVPAGKYRLKFKDQGNCDTIITPFYTIGDLGRINMDSSAMLVNASNCWQASGTIKGININGATNYQWNNSDGEIISQQIDPGFVLPGRYVLKAYNSYGCETSTKPITVPVRAGLSNIFLPAPESNPGLCNIPNGYIRFYNYSNTPNYTFRWVDSSSSATVGHNLNLENVVGGTFYLYAQNLKGCEQMVFSANLKATASPHFQEENVKLTDDICSQEKGAITNISMEPNTGFPSFTYTWYDEQNNIAGTSKELTNVKEGKYFLIVRDSKDCQDTSRVYTIKNRWQNYSKPLYPELTILKGTAATLSIQNLQPGIYQLFASSFATVPISENTSGNFSTGNLLADTIVYVKVKKGLCESELTAVPIKVVNETRVFVPTAFTPNGDNKNDVMRPTVFGLLQLEFFTIFNRWGEVVFTTKDLMKGWDGYYKQVPAPGGVYVWMLKGKDIKGNIIQLKGSFVLLR